MVQWCFSGWLSFGIHLDFKHRHSKKYGISYGPYVDLHFLFAIFSFGINPYYSGEWESIINAGRGGEIV
jgi:hypothetical protein